MSPMTSDRPRWSDHRLGLAAVVVTSILLAITAGLLAWEQTWGEPRRAYGGQTAFVAGSVGTEFVPLVVLEVLPAIDAEAFPEPAPNANGSLAGGWVAKYGFLDRRGDEPTFPPTDAELVQVLKADEE